MQYCPKEYFLLEEYIVTVTGNKISRQADIPKPQSLEIPSGRVIVKGRAVLDSQSAHISINRFTIISDGCILEPGYIESPEKRFIPMTIGTHCYVGRNCCIQAAQIGSGCFIGENSVISPRVILKDFVKVEPNTVIPPDMVVPPFAVVAGNPAKLIGEQPCSMSTLAHSDAVLRYNSFLPKS